MANGSDNDGKVKLAERFLSSFMNNTHINVNAPGAIGVQNNLYLNGKRVEPNAKAKVLLLDDTLQYCSRVEAIDVAPASKKDYDEHLEKQNEFYRITRHEKGLALIVSCTFPDTKQGTPGNDRDVENHKILWKKLGFKVGSPKDIKADRLIGFLQEFVKSDKAIDCDCIVMVFLTHGNEKDGEDVVFAGDGKSIKVGEILDIFNNENARRLQGTPKVFFFSTCRGENGDSGVEKFKQAVEDHVKEEGSQDNTTQAGNSRAEKIPKVSDVIVFYGSQPGYVGYRSDVNGNWHSNACVNVFSRHALDRDVAEMAPIINSAMEKRTAKTETTNSGKQMSGFTSTLTKKLFLFPGFPRETTDKDYGFEFS